MSKDIDKWVERFKQNTPEDATSRQAYMNQTASEIFTPSPPRTSEQTTAEIRDIVHNVGMGMFKFPAKVVEGAVGLVSPEAADSINRGIQGISDFQNQNVPGSPYSLSPEATQFSQNVGQVFTGSMLPFQGLNTIPGSAALGALGGISAREEGSTRGDVLTSGLVGGAAGAAVSAGSQLVGKAVDAGLNTFEGIKNFGAKILGKTSGDTYNKAKELDKAFRSELNSTYKQLGVNPKGMTPDELLAHRKFIDEFAFKYNDKVQQQYTTALQKQAPEELANYVKSAVPKATYNDALKTMQESVDPEMITAVQNPDSMLFYQQLQVAIRDSLKGGKGSGRLAGDIVDKMKSVSPEYTSAIDMYNTKSLLEKGASGNFIQAIRQEKSMIPVTMDLIKSADGKEFVDRLFVDGFRKELVKNANQPAVFQLQKALGNNPLERQNTIDFLVSTGQEQLANKYKALVGFSDVVEQSAQLKSKAAKYFGEAVEQLPKEELAGAMKNILTSGNKWSDQFNKIITQQTNALMKSEAIANLLRRASAASAGTIVGATNNEESGRETSTALQNILNNNNRTGY